MFNEGKPYIFYFKPGGKLNRTNYIKNQAWSAKKSPNICMLSKFKFIKFECVKSFIQNELQLSVIMFKLNRIQISPQIIPSKLNLGDDKYRFNAKAFKLWHKYWKVFPCHAKLYHKEHCSYCVIVWRTLNTLEYQSYSNDTIL